MDGFPRCFRARVRVHPGLWPPTGWHSRPSFDARPGWRSTSHGVQNNSIQAGSRIPMGVTLALDAPSATLIIVLRVSAVHPVRDTVKPQHERTESSSLGRGRERPRQAAHPPLPPRALENPQTIICPKSSGFSARTASRARSTSRDRPRLRHCSRRDPIEMRRSSSARSFSSVRACHCR